MCLFSALDPFPHILGHEQGIWSVFKLMSFLPLRKVLTKIHRIFMNFHPEISSATLRLLQ